MAVRAEPPRRSATWSMWMHSSALILAVGPLCPGCSFSSRWWLRFPWCALCCAATLHEQDSTANERFQGGAPMLSISLKAFRRRIPLAVICIALVLALAPVVWFLLTSLKDRSETFQIPPAWFFTPTLDHYKNVMGLGGKLTSLYQAGRIDNFFDAGINSIVIAVGSTLLST